MSLPVGSLELAQVDMFRSRCGDIANQMRQIRTDTVPIRDVAGKLFGCHSPLVRIRGQLRYHSKITSRSFSKSDSRPHLSTIHTRQ